MMEKRMPSPEDEQVLLLANQGSGRLVIVPIIFNGESRFALAFHGTNAHGQYLRVLGVLPVPSDVVQDGNGNPVSSFPPGAQATLN